MYKWLSALCIGYLILVMCGVFIGLFISRLLDTGLAPTPMDAPVYVLRCDEWSTTGIKYCTGWKYTIVEIEG